MNAKTYLPVVQIMLYFVSRTVDLSSWNPMRILNEEGSC